MKTFPMFLTMTGRRVVIAGGGEQAAQKARLILKTEAEIVLLADELDAELIGLVEQGKATHIAGPLTKAHFKDAALVFVATGCAGADAALHDVAKAAGGVVNVVDRPELCDAITPSIVDRDPVVVAIGTEGTAPVLGRSIKTQIETMLPPRLGHLAALAGRLRGAVARHVPKAQRRAFWAWVFKGGPANQHSKGQEVHAAQTIKAAIENGGRPDQAAQEGSICLVGAGPGARDLLTLRAVERLQEADIIFYDRLVDPGVLELARRDAERVFVGKQVGANVWPQDKICSLIVAEARQGKRVLRLKSGDPMIFGRATEEIDAAKAANVAVEVIPGVTAVSAAAASLGESLTQRGETDTLILTTGRCKPGDAPPNWAAYLQPGASLAIYMGAGVTEQIAANLIEAGLPTQMQIDLCVDVSKEGEKHIKTDIANLSDSVAEHRIREGAVILMRLAKRAESAALQVA
ncbi:MAG: siroheme synthase CysG [Pseudomonadota bacterium]